MRQPTATDRRSHSLYLTAKGKALFEKANLLVLQREQELAKKLGQQKYDQLLDLLNRLAQVTNDEMNAPEADE